MTCLEKCIDNCKANNYVVKSANLFATSLDVITGSMLHQR